MWRSAIRLVVVAASRLRTVLHSIPAWGRSRGQPVVCRYGMARPSVYIETTVISYLCALPSRDLIVAAHQQLTREWWDQAVPKLDPYVSPFVIDEISQGDAGVATRRLAAVASFPVLGVSADVGDLARRYFAAIDLPDRARTDSLHLASAAWHGMEYLASWNCTHIASARVRKIVAEINGQLGIQTPTICTPEELMEV